MKSKKTTATRSPFAAFVEDDVFAPAPESADYEVKKEYGLFIDGKFRAASKAKTFDTINPATEAKLSKVADASPKDVDTAVKAARKAYDKTWSKLPAAERGKYLFRIARLLQERAREFAVIETLDGGKPIRESRDIDIPLVCAHFFHYAGWADKLEYAFPGRKAAPVGVAGQVIPWNFPLLMAAWKIAPALACGNTVVLKPAETTPLTALKLAEVLQDAIDKVASTGSTEVGKLIRKQLAASGKPATLELGGKAAHIIFQDAPIDQAVEGIVNGIFFNQGHVCCAGSRLLVEESVLDVVVEKLKRRMETLVVGDPMDKNTDVGAINSKAQFDRINLLVDQGVKEGGCLYRPKRRVPRKGYFIAPSIFTEVSQTHRIVQEEIFGPILTIQTFRTPDEAVAKANNTPYGLSAGVWTSKGSKIFEITSRLQAGVVWANTYNRFDPTSPFGGYKESGIGREGGIHGLAPYLKLS